MSNVFTSVIKLLIAVPVMALALVSCSDVKPLSPEEAVTQRAQGWLDALLDGNLEGAYAFTSPSYRQSATAGRYHARIEGAGRWTTGAVDRATCKDSVCEVRIIVEYEIPQMGVHNRRPLDYVWIEVDGQWWLYVSAQ